MSVSRLKMNQPAPHSASAVLSILSNYQKLAEDKNKRYFLAKDHACVQFLAYVMDDGNSEVILSTLKVLQLLIENPENAFLVSQVFGVKQALQNLITSSKHGKDVISLAKDLYEAVTTVDRESSSLANPLRDMQNKTHLNSVSDPRKSSNSRAAQLIFNVHGIKNKGDRETCVNSLVKVKGVVSIMFDTSCTRCTIRAKREVTPEALISAMEANQSFTAYQLVKNENGVEFAKPRLVFNQSDSFNATDKENKKLPDYLPEEDDHGDGNRGAIARPGNSHSSAAGGWFNSAASFLTKSFYW